MATRVLPSPVLISAMVPRCSTMPPISCTSKWRMFSTRLPASRTTANASGRRSSSVAPLASRCRNSAVMALSSASDLACMAGSSSPMRATSGRIAFSVRAFLVPKTCLRM